MKKLLQIVCLVLLTITPSTLLAEIYKELIPKENISDYIVHHEYYSLGYDEETEQAAWVMYEYTKEEASTPRVQRKDRFRPDPAIPTHSATLQDYKKSGFDRGHLAPAADMAFCTQAMRDSFLMSNMSPQRPKFNRGIWKKLEAQVRKWAEQDTIIVVTAGVLSGNQYIGRNHVLVPEAYYKIIYVPSQNKAIAFLLPNKGSKKKLSSFAVSINTIEALTGINFFSAMEDSQEDTLESQCNITSWDWARTK
ncbi:DNA/RNA non-specific endonuclease [Halodesulfovibrio marinisediminis]|uniref:Endonuclease n=1 Tax=Halodesulfovibrio marinisediminis DSM 17456 TaxID=1121457 RepID=A0A1N6HDK4_9BACT|nr:DNA/RNA non-specific endonuclease [Halodesulfovibrio marinisediminis]SIO17921.1 endonuclease G [Halodesulfovibrio marinisediminis DSM 17456]